MSGETYPPPGSSRAGRSVVRRYARPVSDTSRLDLLAALTERVVVADGAMGTMLQAHDLTLADFQEHEGCNEVLNVTRPDVVRAVHDAYFEVGCDAVETNTFGSNWAALNEY